MMEKVQGRMPRYALACQPQLATAVDMPVFQGWGERDHTPDPHRDGAYFGSCPDYTLVVPPRSGHCHNFATMRGALWDRLIAWASAFS